MLKFKATVAAKGGDRTLIGLGLSDMNVEKLTAGDPIMIRGEDVGVAEQDILIFHGKTEEDMKASIAKLIGPKTQVINVD